MDTQTASPNLKELVVLWEWYRWNKYVNKRVLVGCTGAVRKELRGRYGDWEKLLHL